MRHGTSVEAEAVEPQAAIQGVRQTFTASGELPEVT